MTLEQTAEEAGYVTYYSRGTGELEETIRVNYEDSNGNTIPCSSAEVVGRGKR